MEERIYVHYGHSEYHPEFIGPVFTRPLSNKPGNALWASAEDAGFGWKEWCEDEEYRLESLRKSFRFRLKPGTKLMRVASVQAAQELFRIAAPQYFPTWMQAGIKPIDFDRLRASGIDAVEVSISECPGLYWELYGWDCDSIAILNPEIVEVVA